MLCCIRIYVKNKDRPCIRVCVLWPKNDTFLLHMDSKAELHALSKHLCHPTEIVITQLKAAKICEFNKQNVRFFIFQGLSHNKLQVLSLY